MNQKVIWNGMALHREPGTCTKMIIRVKTTVERSFQTDLRPQRQEALAMRQQNKAATTIYQHIKSQTTDNSRLLQWE